MPKRIPECRLCGHAHWSYQPHKLIGGPEPSKAVKALVKDTVTVATGPMTEAEAREITERIRRTQDDWCRLVYEAYERQAWKAMRYGSWVDYVADELPMSRSRSYQLLAHAKLTLALGIGNGVHNVDTPTEGQTRILSGEARKRVTKAATIDADAGRNQLTHEVERAAETGCEHLFRCVRCGAEQ